MRVVKGPPQGAERVYCPEIEGSRDHGVRITIRNPTNRDKREVFPIYNREPDSLEWAYSLINRCVCKVSGYSFVDAKGDTRPIETADDLINHGEDDVIGDLAGELLTAASLQEDERKNSERPSASTQAATSPSHGTAESASVPALPHTATATDATKTLDFATS